MQMRFVDLYRPRRFSDVYGQDRVKALLSSLILRNKIHRNLLFIGDRGSGKTSLARLYANALNCERNEPDGSPCGLCPMCSDPSRSGLFEYDTAGSGGDKQRIERFVYNATNSILDCRTRVIFFDESHALEAEASDALLKRVEEANANMVFCFATTAPGEMSEPLLSRLMIHEVGALESSVAIRFLQDITAKAKVECEPEALAILAAAKRNFPRDLLIGLEQVVEEGHRLTVEAVKDAFGIDQADILARFFAALATGDARQQSHVLEHWNEDPLQKAEWIRNFTLSLYYNNVRGLSVIVDPLIHAATQQHNKIVTDLKERLRPEDEAAFVTFWVGLLEFWVRYRPIDNSGAQLSIALFQYLMTQGYLPAITSLQQNSSVQIDGSSLFHDEADLVSNEQSVESDDEEYVGPTDVRKIISRASIQIQNTGEPFNVALEIRPTERAQTDEDAARAELEGFVQSFEETFDQAASERSVPFAGIVLFEHDEDGYHALIVARIPLETKDATQKLMSFRAAKMAPNDQGEQLEITLRRSSPSTQLSFHWDAVFNLCKSAYERNDKGLLDKLKISRRSRREPRPVRPPRIVYAGILQDDAVRRAERLGMTFLSAIDDSAFTVINKGWEFDEFRDRQREIRRRSEDLRTVRMTYAGDEGHLSAAERQLFDGWGGDPKQRPRTWKKKWRWWL
jgi:DNA polymerase-3 subunit gamma/tau